MNKKKLWIIGCISILLLVMGVSFAYWSLTFTQTNENIVTTDCFEIEFLEGNAINLNKVYPISDTDGLKNDPYTFTIKNVCDGSANYQINLETLIPSGKKLPDKYLKLDLKSENKSLITEKLDKELNLNLDTELTIEGAAEAYKLATGYLKPKEEKSFELRLWMHSDVTASDKDSMNAEYNGKISVITSYSLTTLIDTLKLVPKVSEGTGLYEVSHSDAEITYTTDPAAINNLKQTELRYAGSNPNNYVRFNNELWRIIGLVNTPEGQRVKLIRNESIGVYSWDSSESSVNNGWGVNEWSTSKLMNLLNNGAYYNRTTGTCYNEINNATTACDFSSIGLTSEAKNMIDTVTWNTGGNGSEAHNSINTNNFYNIERGNSTGSICTGKNTCNDTAARTTTWVGQVGLMYPSDYGYATSGGTTTNRSVCLNTILYSENSNSVSDCVHNNWLHKEGISQWTITPLAHSGDSASIFFVYSLSQLYSTNACVARISMPTIFLKLNIKLTNGTGEQNNPFQLEI